MNTHTFEIYAVVRTVCEQGMTDLLGLVAEVIANEDETHIAAIIWNDGALLEILEVVV